MKNADDLLGKDGVFASRLRELYNAAEPSLTLEDVGSAIGVTRQTFSKYLEGKAKPTIENIFNLANYFGVSSDYLLGLSPNPSVDMNVAKIGELTGLSEAAINELRSQVKADEVYNFYQRGCVLSYFQIINALIEQERKDQTTLDLLGEVLIHTDEDAPFIIMHRTKYDDKGDIVEGEMVDNPPNLDPQDVFYIRLLKLQQAIIDLKKDYDKKRKSKGGNN